MRLPLSLAVAQPRCVPGDARPMTGYELDAALVDPGADALSPVVQACAATGSTALVGAPILGPAGRAYTAMLAVSSEGVAMLYRKQWIGGDEAIRFSAGDKPTVLGAVSITERCRAYVAFAGFAGPTGGEYHRTTGTSAIWSPSGDVLAQAAIMPGDLAQATLT